MRTLTTIYTDLLREREKLCSMRLGEPGTLEQSREEYEKVMRHKDYYIYKSADLLRLGA